MADGSLTPIEDLEVGDAILAADPTTGERTREVVITPLHSRGDKQLIALAFEGDTAATIATHNHPYWIEGRGWTAAVDLAVGDVTLSSSGDPRILVSVTDLGRFAAQDVYNLHASGPHTYFVTGPTGTRDQLVHNSAPSCSITGETIVSQRGVRISIHNSREHAPAHAHVTGGRGAETRIGQNGKPLKGQPELSARQARVVRDNIRTIRKVIRVSMRQFRGQR